MPLTCSAPGSAASSVVDPAGMTETSSDSPASQLDSAARSGSGSAPRSSVTTAASVAASVPFCMPTDTASPSPARTIPLPRGESVNTASPVGWSAVGSGVGATCALRGGAVAGAARAGDETSGAATSRIAAAAAMTALRGRARSTRRSTRGPEGGEVTVMWDFAPVRFMTARSGEILRSDPPSNPCRARWRAGRPGSPVGDERVEWTSASRTRPRAVPGTGCRSR